MTRRFFLRLIGTVGVLAIVAMITMSASVSAVARHQTSSPPSGLTSQGRLLWNLEALLSKTFGTRQPFVSGRENFSCSGTSCSPLSKYSPFTYTFAHLGASQFRTTSRNISKYSFGNYPEPVLIRGKAVVCNSIGTKYLIVYKDQASFTLGCVSPLPT